MPLRGPRRGFNRARAKFRFLKMVKNTFLVAFVLLVTFVVKSKVQQNSFVKA
jgi:hypothetical protein